MPTAFALAAIVFVVVGVLHSYLGERVLFGRLFALPDLPLMRRDRLYTERVIRYAWHVTSITWWGLAGVLALLAAQRASPAAVGAVVGGSALVTGVVVLATCGRRHPAWPFFFAIAALTFLGTSALSS